ncbi:hypothetical protein TDB9533_02363 [Thalassocella blandensis]|nr:hypothetical protein TDB9533_02363 [Thalassocella blandensis]
MQRLLNTSLLIFGGCFAASHAQALQGQQVEFFSEVSSFSYSDVATIKQTADSLKGPAIRSGEFAVTANYASFGNKIHFANQDNYLGVKIFQRVDYYLEFTPDTAHLIYADQNDIELSGEKDYQVDMFSNSISASGIAAIYGGRPLDQVKLELTLSFMEVDYMNYGRLWGNLNSLSNDAEGKLNLDYHYSDDVFFDREESGEKAKGWSVDVNASWTISPSFDISLASRDLMSEIRWDQQDRTVAQANSDRLVNTEGQLKVRPALSWIESETDIVQKLPRQIDFRQNYHLNQNNTVGLQQYVYDSRVFFRSYYERSFNRYGRVKTYYDWSVDAFGLAYHSKLFYFDIASDSKDFEKAYTFSLSMGLNIKV